MLPFPVKKSGQRIRGHGCFDVSGPEPIGSTDVLIACSNM